MANTGTTVPPDRVTSRHFLLSNGERVVYAPTKDEEEDASLSFIGKKLNWLTDYYVQDKSFPRITRELEGNESLASPSAPTADRTTAPYKLQGSIRTGLYVLADEGKPPPTPKQRDPSHIDLRAGREFVLDNGERVLSLYIGFEDMEFIGSSVKFSPISGAPPTTPRIVRELKGSQKSTVLSEDGPTNDNPTIPYILWGFSGSFFTPPYIDPIAMADANARRTAAFNADIERLYDAVSEHPDLSTCREFLLNNGQRVIYVPGKARIEKAHKNKDFKGLDVGFVGEGKTFIVREVEAGEKSTVFSPIGPTHDKPTAPYILNGTISGGLYTLPPRPAPSVPDGPPAGVHDVPPAGIPDEPPSGADIPPTGTPSHADTGRLFPVVSTTSISAEIKDCKDRLIQATIDYDSSVPSFLVLVESLSEKYSSESWPGESTTNISSSPFQNKSPHECAVLLRKLWQETGSDINFEYFVILDERSLEDNTVLMVEAIRADEYDSDDSAAAAAEGDPQALRIQTLRAEMGIVNSRFLFYLVEIDMREDIERLEEEGVEDGVLRD
ncbi:hypothetical protein LTS10_012963 [Elasticomyces elasticus]|nr:hypothetical protein LTS10_012963 [Elasticomyces elasticus]